MEARQAVPPQHAAIRRKDTSGWKTARDSYTTRRAVNGVGLISVSSRCQSNLLTPAQLYLDIGS